MSGRNLWFGAAILSFATAAVTAFGSDQTVFAGMWVAVGCMFLVFAVSGRA